MKPYDYLIVGSGLFGAVFAHEAHKAGKNTSIMQADSWNISAWYSYPDTSRIYLTSKTMQS